MSKILIVAEDIQVGRGLGKFLTSNGFTVHVANQSSDVRQFLSEIAFNLIIIDGEAPDLSEIETFIPMLYVSEIIRPFKINEFRNRVNTLLFEDFMRAS